MNVISWVIRGIELDHPVNLWDVESTGRDISANECTRLCVAELKETIGSSLLLELPVEVQDGKIYVIQH